MAFLPASRPVRLGVLAISAALSLPVFTSPATAQREIVQPLPRPEADDLNDALRRLSANPADLDALLQAGKASLVLRDVGAAEGFYTRALAVAPGNGFVRLGLARVRLERRDPVAALRLFDEAEQAGVPASALAADRAFAYDLVGDQARAQAAYRTALSEREDAEIRRRLALSLAISGERQAFENTILPLLNADNRAAFRTRAFGLAILGQEQEAVVIAETMLPTDLALRLAPYLRYMPRLTAAQQAAAANLGVFPPAAEIGRDDEAIAGYAAQGQRIARSADASLTPTGRALGANRTQTPAATTSTSVPVRAPPPTSTAPTTNAAAPPVRGTPTVAAAPAQASALPQISTRVREETPAQELPPASSPPATSQAVVVAAIPSGSAPAVTLPDEGPVSILPAQAAPSLAASSPPQTVAVAASTPEPVRSASVADAFADLGLSTPSLGNRPPDAVDITAITPPREVERVEPPAPVHPARHWVQVATGRDLAALKFDWRRIVRSADGKLDGKGPFTTPWGQANRLLAGPYPTSAAAREIVTELKALDIDSFPFSSDEGQEIAALD